MMFIVTKNCGEISFSHTGDVYSYKICGEIYFRTKVKVFFKINPFNHGQNTYLINLM